MSQNDDSISRQQAIDALCSVCNALGGGHNCDKTKFVYNAPFDEQVILCPEHYALTMLPSIQSETNCSEFPNNSDTISRQVVAKFLEDWLFCLDENCHKQSASDLKMIIKDFKNLPSAQPERKTGYWILDRSGAYCCDKCMEPCASYAMMKPRDKFCKMCGSRNEVME